MSFPIAISLPTLSSSFLKGPNSGLAAMNSAFSIVMPVLRLLAISWRASGSIESVNEPFFSAENTRYRYMNVCIEAKDAASTIQKL